MDTTAQIDAKVNAPHFDVTVEFWGIIQQPEHDDLITNLAFYIF